MFKKFRNAVEVVFKAIFQRQEYLQRRFLIGQADSLVRKQEMLERLSEIQQDIEKVTSQNCEIIEMKLFALKPSAADIQKEMDRFKSEIDKEFKQFLTAPFNEHAGGPADLAGKKFPKAKNTYLKNRLYLN